VVTATAIDPSVIEDEVYSSRVRGCGEPAEAPAVTPTSGPH
jgi:hypothetical protein